MATEEEVASQAAVEILDQRTGSDRLLGQRDNRELSPMESAPELLS
jgi:hypothetical protein